MPDNNKRKENLSILAVTAVVLVLTTAPYLYAAGFAGPDHVFGGFLLNPIDGNTYLAKMFQGQRGDWVYHLPFTADPGQGASIFLFYLGLGHLARLSGLALPVVFHLARLAGALCMLAALARFFGVLFPDRGPRVFAFSLAALGSGVGWLALPFGGFTSDFWVAEAYPFLSAYSSPHFCLGLALLLWLVVPDERPVGSEGKTRIWSLARREWISLLMGLLLSILLPFGVVLAVLILLGVAAWDFASSRDLAAVFYPGSPARRAIAAGLGGGPFAVYYLWTVASIPAFAGWNAQNQTPSPPLWDLFLSLSPALILAVVGGWLSARRKTPGDRLLLVWAVSGLLCLYLPVGLQRRFMMGFYIPVAALATIGLEHIKAGRKGRANFLSPAVFTVSLITNLLILITVLQGVQTKEPLLYLTRGEYAALQWINQHTPPEALVIASPQMGLYIPAYTGRRVIYGHPFETLNAEEEKAQVTRYFSGGQPANFLLNRKVDYVFYGPREKALGAAPPEDGLSAVFSQAGVTLYAVNYR